MVRNQKTPEYAHRFHVRQFCRLFFLSMEMGDAVISDWRHSDYGERRCENYNANAKEKKTQGKGKL